MSKHATTRWTESERVENGCKSIAEHVKKKRGFPKKRFNPKERSIVNCNNNCMTKIYAVKIDAKDAKTTLRPKTRISWNAGNNL